MTEILLKAADTILTMDDQQNEISNQDIRIKDGVITEIGPNLASAGEVINARNTVVTPGLVNTHHHLYQTLTRAVPGGQDALLFGWLQTLYPIWSRFGREVVTNLTTVSRAVRGFAVVLLGRYFGERLVGEGRATEEGVVPIPAFV